MRTQTGVVSILTVAGVMLAGCGNDDHAAAPLSTPAPTSRSVTASDARAAAAEAHPPSSDAIPAIGPTWLATEDSGGLGTIVVDSSGRTIYAFDNDTPRNSTCYGRCADTWSPLLTTAVPAGGIGIDVAKAAMITRRDGSHQASTPDTRCTTMRATPGRGRSTARTSTFSAAGGMCLPPPAAKCTDDLHRD